VTKVRDWRKMPEVLVRLLEKRTNVGLEKLLDRIKTATTKTKEDSGYHDLEDIEPITVTFFREVS
jgi:hypothetical protein